MLAGLLIPRKNVVMLLIQRTPWVKQDLQGATALTARPLLQLDIIAQKFQVVHIISTELK